MDTDDILTTLIILFVFIFVFCIGGAIGEATADHYQENVCQYLGGEFSGEYCIKNNRVINIKEK